MNSPVRKMVTLAATIFTMASLAAIAHAQAPSDPQIVGIVVAANQIDIDYGKIALKKAKSKEVREFAQQMITDHSAVQKSVFDLGAKLKVTPADSDTSTSLKAQAEETKKKFHTLKGKAFDKAYIDNEVAYHKTVVDANATVLMPNAQNSELKAALTGAQPLFQGHLDHAKNVQSDLDSKKSKSKKHIM